MTYLRPEMRFFLLTISILAFVTIVVHIRKRRVRIEDTVFWVAISLGLVFLSVMPGTVYFIARILRIESPANFVFLLLISILLVNQFFLTMKVSDLNIKLREIAQKEALDNMKKDDKSEREDK